MRKILVAAAGAAVLAAAAGLALAQDRGPRGGLGDSNNDGVVTRQEFDAAHAARFTQADANRDGQLAGDEMRRRREGGPGHDGPRRHREGRMGGMMGSDANNDGNITREEFLARPIAVFERLDANHDGIIQASERPQRRERAEGERRERARPDADNNGSISQSEFAAMGASMFERMDANNDGRLTQDETQRQRHRQPAE